MPKKPYSWDKPKRLANLEKHGLDFKSAWLVLENEYRLDVSSERNGELRIQSFAYVFEYLSVLTAVYLDGRSIQIISFRRASSEEREAYHEWLEKDYDRA